MGVLVTGATGFVGGHVARQLVAAGAEVRCLVRESSSRRNLRDLNVTTAVGDLRDAAAVRAAVAGCRQVYHCGADYRLWVPHPPEMYAANVDGTRNVMRAAAAEGVQRVVYTSSVGALGLRADGEPADENEPVGLGDMTGHYKRSKFLAERVVEEWAGRGVPVVIVNPSAPVGEGDLKPTDTGRIILDFLRGMVPVYIGTGLNLVDVRDVARGHLLAAEKGRIGQKYILGNRDMSLGEIYRVLARISGRPAPRYRLPYWLPWGVAAIDTGLARLRGRRPRIPLDAVRLARHRMYFDPGRARRELGLPQTPVEQALARAVRWFRDHGYVDG
ncbi:MAG: hopanoid-associated sugar epimerase [Thermoanaerobaculia bacterium]